MGAPNLDAGEAVLAAVAAQSIPETSLHTWAWEPINEGISGLLAGPNEVDVDNLEIPGRDGRYPFAPVLDQGIYRVPMIIVGSHTPDGTPYTNHAVGLRRNVVLFRRHVCPLIETETGVRELTLTTIDPEESPLLVDVQVLPLQVQDASPTAWEVVLPIYVPDGGVPLDGGS
jgi:hypothetical protein